MSVHKANRNRSTSLIPHQIAVKVAQTCWEALHNSAAPFVTPDPPSKIANMANIITVGYNPLVEALEALPLEFFNKPDNEIDAADFKDHSTEFIAAMRLARIALSQVRRRESSNGVSR